MRTYHFFGIAPAVVFSTHAIACYKRAGQTFPKDAGSHMYHSMLLEWKIHSMLVQLLIRDWQGLGTHKHGEEGKRDLCWCCLLVDQVNSMTFNDHPTCNLPLDSPDYLFCTRRRSGVCRPLDPQGWEWSRLHWFICFACLLERLRDTCDRSECADPVL